MLPGSASGCGRASPPRLPAAPRRRNSSAGPPSAHSRSCGRAAARPHPLGCTRLGHLEIVRPRRFRSLSETMLGPSGRHKSPATLAFEALRRLAAEARANPAASWRLMVVPSVELALRGPAAAALAALENRLGRRVAVAPLPVVETGADVAPF